MDKRIFIVFFSANGSTRLVAETIQAGFEKWDADVSLHAVGDPAETAGLLDKIQAAGSQAVLLIGSPVYRDGAVPAVMAFINALAPIDGALAVPFVTWGKACSGVALWQMGAALISKGFALAGAAKVLAVHSMMWRVENPPGGGHPDEDERRQLSEMVATIWDRFSSANPPLIELDRLDYQPAELSLQMKEKVAAPWMIVPKSVDQTACSQCGVCEEVCPVQAIGLDPYPEFGETCCDCFNCIRLCPEDAIEPAKSMDQIEEYIRERVKNIDEKPLTEIFLK